MSVALPLLRALLRAESAFRKAATESARRRSVLSTTTTTTPSSDKGEEEENSVLLRFRDPMDTTAWQRGRYGWTRGGDDYHLAAARGAVLGGGGTGNDLDGGDGDGSAVVPLGLPLTGVFRGTQLRRLILSNFRAAAAASRRESPPPSSPFEDAGFAVLRSLGQQTKMERCSSSSLSRNGCVEVEATSALVATLPRRDGSPSSSGSPLLRHTALKGTPGVIVIRSVAEDEGEEEEGKGENDGGDKESREGGEERSDDGGESSSPAPAPSQNMRYIFTYRLRIRNVSGSRLGAGGGGGGDEEGGSGSGGGATTASDEGEDRRRRQQRPRAVQLLSRGWIIRDSSGTVHAAVPRGSPGVIGQTPTLLPGETFEYYSSTDLATPSGVMSGSFGFAFVDDGDGESGEGENSKAKERFEVPVAPFPLRAEPFFPSSKAV